MTFHSTSPVLTVLSKNDPLRYPVYMSPPSGIPYACPPPGISSVSPQVCGFSARCHIVLCPPPHHVGPAAYVNAVTRVNTFR